MNEPELAAGMAPTSAYRYAEVVGDRLFVAGQVPVAQDRTIIGADDPEAQVIACLDNLRTLVGVHGFAVSDVRQLVVHVVGPHEHLLAAWRGVRAFFDDDVPPATLLGTTCLGHAGQLVEVDATVMRS